MTDDGKGVKAGWSDRELLVCLLAAVEKSGAALNFKDIGYPAGRNANGFKQKINMLKRELRPEWDALAAGMPVPETTPKKTATPRKRKAKSDEDGDVEAEATPKKARGRPKKKPTTPEAVEDDEESETKVKDEGLVKDEDIEDAE